MSINNQHAALCMQTNPGLQKLVMGAVGLPFGLIMVMICGAELFTGNTMIMGCAFYEGRITLPQLLRSWVVSFGSESPRAPVAAFCNEHCRHLFVCCDVVHATCRWAIRWTHRCQHYLRHVVCSA
jgi:Formate/nitrite transporter